MEMNWKEHENEVRNAMKGGIMGVICGDALGLPVQFLSREEIRKSPVTGMRGYGTFHLPEGSWSDDSSLTIASMDSILHHGLDLSAMMKNFAAWLKDGKFTPYGCAYDIGRTCCTAIENYMAGADTAHCGLSGNRDCGNGALMRILPTALYLLTENNCGEMEDKEVFLTQLHASTALTHAHPVALMASGIYTEILGAILRDRYGTKGRTLRELAEEGIAAAKKEYTVMRRGNIREMDEEKYVKYFEKYSRLTDIAGFAALSEDEIRGSGYVVDTLEAAIWCCLNTENYMDCVLKAVNLGLDTDSVAAVAGGLAGAYYGIDAIPEEWLGTLTRIDWIMDLTERFCDVMMKGRENINPPVSLAEFTEAVRKRYEKDVCEEMKESAGKYFESEEAQKMIADRYSSINEEYQELNTTKEQFLGGDASTVAYCLSLMWE